jgi:thiol-disulfide isomerase/thioredoxin
MQISYILEVITHQHAKGPASFSMPKLFLLLLLVAALALNAAAQSGRRTTTTRSTPIAPVQAPLNPEPELKTAPTAPPSKLLSLPESLRERQIETLDSGSFRFADFQGKVVVINLWATWCGPCRREVPEYEKVRQAYAGREVEFIALTTEDPYTAADRVRKFVRNVGFSFRIGWADRETARTLMNGRNAVPQTLVIDADGRIVTHWSGYAPGRSGDRLKQAIDSALESIQRL